MVKVFSCGGISGVGRQSTGRHHWDTCKRISVSHWCWYACVVVSAALDGKEQYFTGERPSRESYSLDGIGMLMWWYQRLETAECHKISVKLPLKYEERISVSRWSRYPYAVIPSALDGRAHYRAEESHTSVHRDMTHFTCSDWISLALS
jgi:hypothetical protein